MFVFYFGIMADLTPPVALAALAASSIAKASDHKIGWKATQIAIAGYVVPFMAVYDPALMLLGSWQDSIYVIVKALVAIGLWGAAIVGYLWAPIGLMRARGGRRRGLPARGCRPGHRRDRLRDGGGLRPVPRRHEPRAASAVS